ncbi:hypothetical protein D3C87_2135860 [compost metagenome]
MIIGEPNCQTAIRIRVHSAVSGLAIHEVLGLMPVNRPMIPLTAPFRPNSWPHMTATATLPPMMEGM